MDVTLRTQLAKINLARGDATERERETCGQASETTGVSSRENVSASDKLLMRMTSRWYGSTRSFVDSPKPYFGFRACGLWISVWVLDLMAHFMQKAWVRVHAA